MEDKSSFAKAMEDKSSFAKAMEDTSSFGKAMEDTSADVSLPSARCVRSSDFATFGGPLKPSPQKKISAQSPIGEDLCHDAVISQRVAIFGFPRRGIPDS